MEDGVLFPLDHEPNIIDRSKCIKVDVATLQPSDMENITFEEFENSCILCIELRELFNSSPLDHLGVQSLFAILYTCVWLVGLFGNGLVLAVVIVSSYMRHRYGLTERIGRLNSAFPVRSVFVVSLACSDLLVTVTSLPVTAVNMFTQIWIFPSFMCYCIGFFQAFSIFQSSFTFTCIAVDRCLLIMRPKHTMITYRLARLIVISMAILACMLASPMAFLMRMEELKPICGSFCVEAWPTSLQRSYYGLCVIVLQFALPAVVSTICYWIIGVRLNKRHTNRFRRGSLGPPTPARWRANEKRIRTNRMMASMVAAFVLLWMPFNILNLLRDLNLSVDIFQKAHLRNANYSLLYAAAHLLAMVSVVWNPIMYAWYNESIRHFLHPVLHFCRPHCARTNSDYMSTRGEEPEQLVENNSIAPYTDTNQYGFAKSGMF